MTSTEGPNGTVTPAGRITIEVYSLEGGNAAVHVTWGSQSAWVPAGSLQLNSYDERIVDIAPNVISERILRQLRGALQAMIGEVWPAF